MGNLKLRKLLAPKRLFGGKSDHKHDYSLQVNIEINNLDNFGNVAWVRNYRGRKCRYCRALLVDEFVKAPIAGLCTIRLKTNHTNRIDITDIEEL